MKNKVVIFVLFVGFALASFRSYAYTIFHIFKPRPVPPAISTLGGLVLSVGIMWIYGKILNRLDE